MTVDECRDELRTNMGMVKKQYRNDTGFGCPIGYAWEYADGRKWDNFRHPEGAIPATLDEAAKLPEGWHPEITDCTTRGGKPLHPWITEGIEEDTLNVRKGYGTTELEARFRLRVEVERAVRANTKESVQ